VPLVFIFYVPLSMKDIKQRTSLIGNVYHNLEVICFVGYGNNSRAIWKCKCLLCGNTINTQSKYLQRGSIRSCGCDLNAKDMYGRKNRKSFGESSMNRIIESYKGNARFKNIAFDITKNRMIELLTGSCYFCGSPPSTTTTYKRMYGQFTYNGIDRLIPDKGYIEGNVVSCCQTCNYLKNSYTEDEFIDIIRKIYEFKFVAKVTEQNV
jgi:hypothetical protein